MELNYLELIMAKPVAVLISDVHYNLQTLDLAGKAMRMAIDKSNELYVPIIVAGDLHDSKANLRAECVNAMLETFKLIKCECYILIGNHDLINEKSCDNSLEFLDSLQDSVRLVRDFPKLAFTPVRCIAYHSDLNKLRTHLKTIPKGSIVVMHQGLKGTNAGEYYSDLTAITPEDVAGLRVISGHYHTRQTIDLPEGGRWDYIGNPYTLNYGEAKDPEKGYQILYDDGSLEFVPTNLRKHIVMQLNALDAIQNKGCIPPQNDDLILIKLHGTKEQLSLVTKDKVRSNIKGLTRDFRLDLIPLEQRADNSQLHQAVELTQSEQFDKLIDSLTNTSPEAKERLKSTWKSL